MEERKKISITGLALLNTLRKAVSDHDAFFIADPQIKSRAAMLAFRSMFIAKKADVPTVGPYIRRCRSCPSTMSGLETAKIPEIRRTQSDAEVKNPEEVPQLFFPIILRTPIP